MLLKNFPAKCGHALVILCTVLHTLDITFKGHLKSTTELTTEVGLEFRTLKALANHEYNLKEPNLKSLQGQEFSYHDNCFSLNYNPLLRKEPACLRCFIAEVSETRTQAMLVLPRHSM